MTGRDDNTRGSEEPGPSHSVTNSNNNQATHVIREGDDNASVSNSVPEASNLPERPNVRERSESIIGTERTPSGPPGAANSNTENVQNGYATFLSSDSGTDNNAEPSDNSNEVVEGEESQGWATYTLNRRATSPFLVAFLTEVDDIGDDFDRSLQERANQAARLLALAREQMQSTSAGRGPANSSAATTEEATSAIMQNSTTTAQTRRRRMRDNMAERRRMRQSAHSEHIGELDEFELHARREIALGVTHGPMQNQRIPVYEGVKHIELLNTTVALQQLTIVASTLTSLRLMNADVKTLDDLLETLPNLRYLDVSRNDIELIDALTFLDSEDTAGIRPISELHHDRLQVLLLDYNPCVLRDHSLQGLKSLETLSCVGTEVCNLWDVTEAVRRCPTLKRVYFRQPHEFQRISGRRMCRSCREFLSNVDVSDDDMLLQDERPFIQFQRVIEDAKPYFVTLDRDHCCLSMPWLNYVHRLEEGMILRGDGNEVYGARMITEETETENNSLVNSGAGPSRKRIRGNDGTATSSSNSHHRPREEDTENGYVAAPAVDASFDYVAQSPICHNVCYRSFILDKCPQLDIIDGYKVREYERGSAKSLLAAWYEEYSKATAVTPPPEQQRHPKAHVTTESVPALTMLREMGMRWKGAISRGPESAAGPSRLATAVVQTTNRHGGTATTSRRSMGVQTASLDELAATTQTEDTSSSPRTATTPSPAAKRQKRSTGQETTGASGLHGASFVTPTRKPKHATPMHQFSSPFRTAIRSPSASVGGAFQKTVTRRLLNRQAVTYYGSWSVRLNPRQFEFNPHLAHCMIVGTTDGKIALYNHHTDQLTGILQTNTSRSILGLSWLNKHPYKFLAGCDRGTIALYDSTLINEDAHSKEAAITAFPHFPKLTSLHANCTDDWFLTSGYINDVGLYDLNRGTKIKDLKALHGKHINVIKFANKSPYLFATSSFDKETKLWDIRAPGPPIFSRTSQEGNVMVCFSPDDRHLLVSAIDNEVKQYTMDGQLHCDFSMRRRRSDRNYTRSYYMNRGDYIVSGSCEEPSIRVYNAQTGKFVTEVDMNCHSTRPDRCLYVQSLRGDPFVDNHMNVLVNYPSPSRGIISDLQTGSLIRIALH